MPSDAISSPDEHTMARAMDDVLRFLGKNEQAAFLKDCVPEANRQKRRRVLTVFGPWTHTTLDQWAYQKPKLVQRVRYALFERAGAAGILDEHGSWSSAPSEAQFRTWVGEIAAELELDPPRVALAVAVELCTGSGDVREAMTELTRKTRWRSKGGGGAAKAVEPVTDGDTDGDTDGEVSDGDRYEELTFSTWLTELGQNPAEWTGWENALAFADKVKELAVARIDERASARQQRLEEVALALAAKATELDYLEKTTWRSWLEPSFLATVNGSLIEEIETLVSRVSSHAELRASGPRRKSEERSHWQALEEHYADIVEIYDAIEVELWAGRSPRPEPVAIPPELSNALQEPQVGEGHCPGLPPPPETAAPREESAPRCAPPPESKSPADRDGAPGDFAERVSESAGSPDEEPLIDIDGADENDAGLTGAPSAATTEESRSNVEDADPAPGESTGAESSLASTVMDVVPAAPPLLEAEEPLQLTSAEPEEPGARPEEAEIGSLARDPGPKSIAGSANVALNLPAELATPENFANAFSLGPGHRPLPAPWRSPDFAARLGAKFDAELAGRPLRFPRLWILAAASDGEDSALPRSQDIQELAAWWSGSSVRSQDPMRATSIRNAYNNAAIEPTARWRVAVLLEALSASSTSALETAFIEEVVHQLELSDHGFEVALIELLSLRTRVRNPVEWLRPVLEPVTELPLATAEQQLSIHRRELFDYFRSVMQAGGGKIQQTHCREAWKDFIEQALPGLKGLFPTEHGGDGKWDADNKKAFVDDIEALHAQVADRRGARLKDRVRMDRIAERLAGYARRVNAAMAQVEGALQRGAGHVGDVSVRTEVFRTLAEGPTPPGPIGGLREILVRALFPKPSTDDTSEPLDIIERDLRENPELLDLLPALRDTAQNSDFGSVKDIIDQRAAAAVLLAPEERPSTEPLPEFLRARGHAHLLGKIVALCGEEDQVRIHAEQQAALEGSRQRLAELESVRLRLSDAASPLSEVLTSVHRRALEVLDLQPPRIRLFTAWLERVLDFGRAQLRAAGDAIVAAAELQGSAVIEQVAPLVAEQRFAEALTALHGRDTLAGRSVRYTQSRRVAANSFKEPARRLAEPDVAPRVPRWLSMPGDHQQERALRTEFAKLVLEDLYPKEQDYIAISARCDDVRQRIDERQLNPCYVPQLQRFGYITIPRIGVRPSDPQFPVRAADAAGQHPNDLVILLAPRITAERREAVLRELRRRSATAAIVDDLDLCRLLNPGGTRPDAILSLLEIALEQQRWTAGSPFGVVEGQHVQLEMYVGRRDEARDLAHTSRYSRLFSGRKLGKSALLRYVEQRYDGRPLPSGKTLRVLYVSAVGIDADVALVDQIVSCLAGRCGPDPEHALRPGEEPALRLERVLTNHVQKQKEDSLLIVLDEADTFVEAELERYQRRAQESCLSWVMSRRIVGLMDSQGLPRIRFVFTGYRVTNTRDGVWFNWGEVLQLVPLPVDEAAELVAAPLARLGIDASEQAAVIAHRCGYQPAVLLRFGARLLSRLEQNHPPTTREIKPVSVTADDVAATFEDDAIQDEIRRVTSNNFRDNDVGAVLFGVLLSLFLAMGPAAVLEAAEDRLIDRLRELDGDFGWMAQEGGNLHEQIKGKLRDLVARQLLVERRLPGDRTGYALKFPHHLTVLAPLAREERSREAIRRIQAGAGAVVHHGARGLLARGDFDVVRDLVTMRPDPTLLIAPVVGHLWSLPPQELRRLLHRGLFDPLSLDRARVFDAVQAASSIPEVLDDPSSVAFYGVNASIVDVLLSRRSPANPMPLFVGGVDLLRHAIRASKQPGANRVHLQAMGLGRLLRGHLAWWFERARGFNFAQPDAIDRIAAATSGIPLLVSFLDRYLKKHDPHGGGLEVTAEILAQSLDELAAHLDDAASLLVQGDAGTLLLPRELELARMLAFAARSNREGTTSWEDLSEHLWPEYASGLALDSSLVGASPIRAEQIVEDQVALEVLEQVGLVPSRPDVAQGLVLERLGAVLPTDALVRLAEHLS